MRTMMRVTELIEKKRSQYQIVLSLIFINAKISTHTGLTFILHCKYGDTLCVYVCYVHVSSREYDSKVKHTAQISQAAYVCIAYEL